MAIEINRLKACAQLARPHHYVKNGFIGLPLFFGAKLHDPRAALGVFLAVIAFSLAAGCVYVLNDILDVREDREHPGKRHRPLASGALNTAEAVVFLIVLLVASLSISVLLLPMDFLYILCSYLLLNGAYSFYLKHIAVLDICCVGIGFVLRIIAGGLVAHVPASSWIITLTFLLAIFLALGKRRDDLNLLSIGHNTRRSLNGYNLEIVSLVMIIMMCAIIIIYLMYCISPDVVLMHGTDNIYLTSFWVILGLVRYMQIVFSEEMGGSPTTILLKDNLLCIVIAGWLGSFYWLIYATRH